MFVCGECGQRYDRQGYCLADGRPLFATDDPLLGTQLGRYRISALLGEGGMGTVYLASQPLIGSRVAIKILSEQCSKKPDLVERFLAEAKAVNLIRHESIASVIDMAKLDDGRPYIVMEYIEGQTLGPLVMHGDAPLGGLVQVMGEVLSALAAAHAIGIVHRDLKPDNILVTNEGHAKVLDFGIAKLAPSLAHLSPRTRTGALLGTPSYMAPEQITGSNEIDERTDVYAAGIVLYEAVTGRLPFAGETLFDLMKQHLDEAPRPPSQLRRDLPPAMEQVILRALEKQPARRFATAMAMADALLEAAQLLPADQWRALVRGSAITGGRSSVTRVRQTPISRSRNPRPSQEPPTTALRKPRASEPPANQPTTGGAYRTPPDQAAQATRPAIAAAKPRPIGLAIGIVAIVAVAVIATLIAVTSGGDDARSTTTDGLVLPASSVPPVVIGGGSEGDHGVRRGSNVHTGANVIVGTGGRPVTTEKATYDPKRFDPIAFLPHALALGRQIYPDADFTELQFYSNVAPNGFVDLTLVVSGDSYIELRSHSKSGKTGGPCYLMIEPDATTVSVRIRHDEQCDHPIRPAPRCTLAQVWKEASRRGRVATYATIGFLHDGKWFFDADREQAGGIETIEDCK
jgi:serine/threonine protein kinase